MHNSTINTLSSSSNILANKFQWDSGNTAHTHNSCLTDIVSSMVVRVSWNRTSAIQVFGAGAYRPDALPVTTWIMSKDFKENSKHWLKPGRITASGIISVSTQLSGIKISFWKPIYGFISSMTLLVALQEGYLAYRNHATAVLKGFLKWWWTFRFPA